MAEGVDLVILAGLQASGKSTFRRERMPDHVVVSKDLMPNNRRRERRQRELVEQALAEGRSVVVDNTNPRPEDRAPLVEIGRRYGARVVGYSFEPDVTASLARNALRSGRERVPPVGILAVRRHLQPVTRHEGFDEVWVVRAADGRFAVAPAPDAGGPWCPATAAGEGGGEGTFQAATGGAEGGGRRGGRPAG